MVVSPISLGSISVARTDACECARRLSIVLINSLYSESRRGDFRERNEEER